MKTTLFNTRQMGQLCNVGERRLQQLRKAKRLSRCGRGLYDPADFATRAFRAWRLRPGERFSPALLDWACVYFRRAVEELTDWRPVDVATTARRFRERLTAVNDARVDAYPVGPDQYTLPEPPADEAAGE